MKIYLKIINVGIMDSFVKISQILPVKFIIMMVIIILPHTAISCLLVVLKKKKRKKVQYILKMESIFNLFIIKF